MSKSRIIIAKEARKLVKRSRRRSDKQDLQEQTKVYQGFGVIQNKEGEEGEEEED